jgi:hypothetical protein
MRPRILVVSGLTGAILGAAVASIWPTTAVFVCQDTPGMENAACAGPMPPNYLPWGIFLGLALGLIIGFLLSKRFASN